MYARIASSLIVSASACVFAPALAQNPSTPDYKAGYEAGYQAALKALKQATPVAAAMAAAPPPASAPEAAPAAPARPPAPSGPSDWWNHSSLLDAALDPAWRHRAEVQFSATDLSGNDAGHAVRGSAKLYSRTNRWTNELLATIDKRKVAQAGGGLNVRDFKMMENSLRYDLSPKLYASGGFILERDDVNYIDRRGTALAGLGYYVFDTPTMRLNTFIGSGWLDETYLEPVPTLVKISGRDSGLLYLYQTFDWQITPQWSLQQGFRQIRDFAESGVYLIDPDRPGLYYTSAMVKRYRNVANLALQYQLSPRSSVSLGVEQRFDSNPWPDVKRRDTTRRLMINLMY